MEIKKLFCLGNPYLEYDNKAVEIGKSLQCDEIITIPCLSVDDFLAHQDSEYIILDVVKDLDKIMVFSDPDMIKNHAMVSMHDFDMGFFIKLLHEMGELTKIKIIGIPASGDVDVKELKRIILE